MLLLSPALIWHWLPGEGGPEAAAAARPRPPGIFERCSWVPGGWQTWQRRVGRTPEPTTRRGRRGGGTEWEREEAAGAAGHSAAGPRRTGEPARPRRGPGASPPRGQAARPWAPCCSRAQAARARCGHRGRIVPGPARGGAGGGQHPACSPGMEGGEVRPRAPHPTPTSPRTPGLGASPFQPCPERLSRQGLASALCPRGRLALGRGSSLSLSCPVHRRIGDNGSCHSGLLEDRRKTHTEAPRWCSEAGHFAQRCCQAAGPPRGPRRPESRRATTPCQTITDSSALPKSILAATLGHDGVGRSMALRTGQRA